MLLSAVAGPCPKVAGAISFRYIIVAIKSIRDIRYNAIISMDNKIIIAIFALVLTITGFVGFTNLDHRGLAIEANKNRNGSADLECGLTDHFMNFIKKNGYGDYNFDRPDVRCGAFGGKANNKDNITRIPIVFVHGTCDVGYGRGGADGY